MTTGQINKNHANDKSLRPKFLNASKGTLPEGRAICTSRNDVISKIAARGARAGQIGGTSVIVGLRHAFSAGPRYEVIEFKF